VLLAACGGDDDAGDHDHAQRLDLERLDGDGSAALLAAFPFQGGYLVTGRPQRLTFMVADVDGPLVDVPDTLDFELFRDGDPVGDPKAVPAHRDGIPTPYYPLVTTFDAPGQWTAMVELGGQQVTQHFVVDDPAAVELIQVGDRVPTVDTPTTTDDRGVEPICTDDPVCSLHDVALTEAMGTGRPTALLVSTPAYCQTGVCGPVLDLLVEAAPEHPDIQFIHAEVWEDAAAVGVQGATPTAIVDALGLRFEPSLFLVAPDGTLTDRYDNVFDREELSAVLRQVAG
jgi:hypothetical protein